MTQNNRSSNKCRSGYKQTIEELRISQENLAVQNEILLNKLIEIENERSHYFNLYNQSPVGLLSINDNGLIEETNQTALNLLGITKEKLVKQPIINFILEEHLDSFNLHYKNFFKMKKPQSCDLQMIKANGSLFWVQLSTANIMDTDDISICYVTMNDISDLKLVTEALYASEEHYRALVNTSPDAIVSFDQTGKIIGWSPGAENIFKVSKTIARGKPLTTFIPLCFQHNPINVLDREYTGGENHIIGKIVELNGLRNQGESFPIEFSFSEWHIGSEKLFTAIIKDISKRKYAEIGLKKEQYLMNILMDTIPDAIYFKDLESRFIRINKAFAKKIGYEDTDQVIGKTDFDFFGQDHAQEAYNDEQKIIHTEQPLINKHELETYPDRPSEWVSTTKMPLYDQNNEIFGTFGISRNITALKIVEKQLQALHNFSQGTIDALTAHICVLDENGTIISINKAWREFADNNPPIPADYGLGCNYLDVCDSSQGPYSAEAAIFAKELRSLIRGDQDHFMLEYPCHIPEGKKRWFIAHVTCFSRESSLRIVIAHENITERKIAQKTTLENEERYRKLTEESHDLIFTHDFELNIISMNPAMENLLGYSLDKHKRLNLYKIIPPNNHHVLTTYLKTIAKEGFYGDRIKFLSRDNSEYIVDYKSTLIEQLDQIPIIRCLAQDITEKIHHDQEVEAVAAMGYAMRVLTPSQDVFSIIIDELNKLVNLDGTAISIEDEENHRSIVEFSTGEWKSWAGTKISPDQGVWFQVYETNNLVMVENAAYRTASDWPGLLGNIQTVLCLPLISNQSLIGALWLGSKDKFNKSVIKILKTLSDFSANIIQNAQLYKQVQNRASTLASLYDASLAINSVLEPDAKLEFLSNIIMDEYQTDRLVYLVYKPEQGCFKTKICLGFQEELQKYIYQTNFAANEELFPIDWVRLNELPLYKPELNNNTELSLGDQSVQSALWAPVKHGKTFFGILGVMSTKPFAFNLNQERLFIQFANQVAVIQKSIE